MTRPGIDDVLRDVRVDCKRLEEVTEAMDHKSAVTTHRHPSSLTSRVNCSFIRLTLIWLSPSGNFLLEPGTGHKPRRFVVERTLGWLNKCRAIPVRYDKKAKNDLGLTRFACALLR